MRPYATGAQSAPSACQGVLQHLLLLWLVLKQCAPHPTPQRHHSPSPVRLSSSHLSLALMHRWRARSRSCQHAQNRTAEGQSVSGYVLKCVRTLKASMFWEHTQARGSTLPRLPLKPCQMVPPAYRK
jgi:hypothetical protein